MDYAEGNTEDEEYLSTEVAVSASCFLLRTAAGPTRAICVVALLDGSHCCFATRQVLTKLASMKEVEHIFAKFYGAFRTPRITEPTVRSAL